jgi:ATP-dependent HslUV protease ATP-binding subunit HslU
MERCWRNSFEAEDRRGETITIDEAYVEARLNTLARDTDLSKFIL